MSRLTCRSSRRIARRCIRETKPLARGSQLSGRDFRRLIGMTRDSKVVRDMAALVRLFAARVSDRATLAELQGMLERPDSWHLAHAFFERVRLKTLGAEQSHNTALACQYLFEEVCAKTLYNLTEPDDPFDSDTPYWIFPNAVSLARSLGMRDAEVVSVVAA